MWEHGGHVATSQLVQTKLTFFPPAYHCLQIAQFDTAHRSAPVSHKEHLFSSTTQKGKAGGGGVPPTCRNPFGARGKLSNWGFANHKNLLFMESWSKVDINLLLCLPLDIAFALCFFVHLQYVSIKTLKTTTLQLAGLIKGSIVFRVMMRYTDASIEDFMEDIEQDYSQPSEPAPSQSSHTPEKSASESGTFIRDKTAGEKEAFSVSKDSYQGGEMGINSQGKPTPGITTSRSGTVESTHRDHMVAPPQVDIDLQRQSPMQDLNVEMIETTQGIRHRQEQEAQAALTERVKRLSKSSDRSDMDRFVRSIPLTEEPASELDAESLSTNVPIEQDVIHQIAKRVSMQLKEAKQRGDSTADYHNLHNLIAQEVAKEQRAGSLPTGSRSNTIHTVHKSKVDQEASTRLVAAPGQSTSSTTAEEQVDRHVKVFRPPADESVPLSNRSKDLRGSMDLVCYSCS